MEINDYLRKVYTYPPCWSLVADIYVNELGVSVDEYNPADSGTRSIADAFRLALHNNKHGFELVQEPKDYDLVLLGRTTKLGLHHCGIYYKGKILHAIDSGNLSENLSTVKDTYKLMQYWRKK